MRRLPLPPTPEGTRYPYQIIPNSEQCDLCQYFGHKFLKNQAAFGSLKPQVTHIYQVLLRAQNRVFINPDPC